MNFLKKAKTTSIIMSLLYVAFGIFLIFAPSGATNLICYLLGALLIISGIAEIFDYFAYGYEPFGLVSGLLQIMFGIVIASITPFIVSSSFFPIIMGLTFLIKSIIALQDCFDYKRAGIKTWWIDFVSAIIMMLFGIVILIRPFSDGAQKAMFLFMGISIIFSGISMMVSTLFISSKAKKIKKSFKEAFAPIEYEIADAKQEKPAKEKKPDEK